MVSNSRPWRERRGLDRELGEEGVSSKVKKNRFHRGKEGQAKRTSLKEGGKA